MVDKSVIGHSCKIWTWG